MVSLKVLEKHGLTEKALKSAFTAEEAAPKVQKLKDLIRQRRLAGMQSNFNTYRTFLAIDKSLASAYDNQEAIISQLFINKGMTGPEACAACASWGLNEANLFYDYTGPDGKKEKRLKIKNFYNITVGLVKAYLTVRWGKLYNDRNLFPLFRYEPTSFTAEKRALCEVLTDQTQRISSDFCLNQTLKQSIFQTLAYGTCIPFVKEPWYCEYQLALESKYTAKAGDTIAKLADQFNVKPAEIRAANPDRAGKVTAGETITIPEHETIVKEGLRYETPHPTRVFFDLSCPTNSINSDSGICYAGYWRVMRYGELDDKSVYWNTDKIPFGANNWFDWSGASLFWAQVYPCSMRFPDSAGAWTYGGAGVGMDNSRDRRMLYSTQMDVDSPVFVSDICMKLVPKQYGLGDYDYPIWMKFIVANDDTVLWAGPVPYCPILYCGYDADSYVSPNPSMALEILPFQVQLSNILSQILFTAKQGLWKAVWYDNQQLDKGVITQLQNKGDDFAGVQFIPYDSKQMRVAQLTPENSFVQMDLGQQASAEMQGQIPVLIDILERLLGMSAAEVGSTATHEQTAEEVRVIASNTSVRVEFTGSFVDDFIRAWKVQLYEAQLAYLNDEFISQVNPTPETLAALRTMGFDVPEDTKETNLYTNGQNKVQIKVQKSKLVLDGFASERDGVNRINSPAVAAVILQGVMTVANNPLLAQSVGSTAILDLLTQAMVLAGAPRDFKLRVDPKASAESQAAQAQQQMQDMGQKIMGEVMKQVGTGIKPLADAIKANQEQIQQVAPALQQVFAQIKAIEDAVKQIAPVTAENKQGLEQIAQATQQTQAAVQQVAQATAQVKQEADATAQAVVELSHSANAVMQPPMPVQEPMQAPALPPGGVPVV